MLLVRGDGIGDALALAPLIAALTSAGHDVSAVLGKASAEAYAPGVFRSVHVLERIPWPKHGSTRESYRTALASARAARYDVALVASEEPEAYGFAHAARIPSRAGFLTGFAKPLKTLTLRRRLTRVVLRAASANRATEHEVETLFRLGDGLHAEAGATRDLTRLRPLVAPPGAGDAPPGARGVVVVQYSGRAGRGPDGLQGFVTLARAVRERYDTLVVGARADREALDEASRALDAPCFAFDRVRPWILEVARARAVVTFDGGAAHVAGMTGVPCVDLFPATPQTAADTRRWYPWAAPHRVLVAGPDAARTADDAVSALADLIGTQR